MSSFGHSAKHNTKFYTGYKNYSRNSQTLYIVYHYYCLLQATAALQMHYFPLLLFIPSLIQQWFIETCLLNQLLIPDVGPNAKDTVTDHVNVFSALMI